MAGQHVAVLRSFGELFHCGPVSGLDDGQLLERFAARRDEAAFAALVALHGPMVLGVCRRVLRDPHDVEDAFQATFLVLVKRAGSIRDPGRLGPWLHGVARRVAMRARAESARRRARRDSSDAGEIAEETAMRPASRAEADEMLGIIDEEVGRLPSRFREAVVLCDLEGRSYVEAARRLRCPLGTLQSRLSRGRARLRSRLVARGVAPAAMAAILADSARAAVPEALADATVRAATAGAASASVAALAVAVSRGLMTSALLKVGGALILASIAMGGVLARDRSLAEPPAGTAAEDPQPQPDRTLELEVIDRDSGAALTRATVWVGPDRGRPGGTQGMTDEEGRYRIAIATGATRSLRVVVAHAGYAPIEIRWASGQPIPDDYTVALERGVSIGGAVRDDRGRPIAGARVHLRIWATPPRGRPERYPEPDAEVAAAVTDDRGRWRSEALPTSVGPGVRLELFTTHPEHVGPQQAITAEALRAFEAATVLKRGRGLSGTVLSPTGRPVAGATIVVQSRSDRTRLQRVQTDRDGRFHTGPFIDPAWREITMVVRAEGFASFAQLLLVPEEIPPQMIRLSPRKPLHGRVVDAQGRPVPEALIGSATEFGFVGLDWEAETDAEGRFIWYEAPVTGTYMLNVLKSPFRQIIGRGIPGGSDDLALVLHRPQRLHGTVTDAETGRPIERFDLITGWGPHRPGWRPEWLRAQSRSFVDGRFELTSSIADQDSYRSIRVEAEGYEPAEFLGFPDSLEDVAHDFKLRRAAPLSGIIRGPDGRPMAGVDVILVWSGSEAPIRNGRLRPGSDGAPTARTRTGPDGRYAFRPPGHPATVLAVHDAGFAPRPIDQGGVPTDLVLAPWGRVEGVARIGQELAAGRTIVGWLLASPYSAPVNYETLTDHSGRFVLDRVAPGRMILGRRSDNQDGQGWTFSGQASLDVKPGEAVRVQLGGTGRPVIGRLAIPEGIKLTHFALGHGGLMPVLREPPYPVDYLEFTRERREAWWAAFSRTPEGLTYLGARDRSYAAEFRPDGTFRIEDVPAGRYVLKLPFEGLSRGSREGRQAFARSEVVVPEIPGGRSDDPIDIGAVPLEVFPFHEPRIGERAPTIAANLPDGRPLDLAAWRGRFVLLHFWSNHPDVAAEITSLKATHDAFGRDPRFIMIGLYGGETPGPLRRYADHRGLSWEQRYIGSIDDPNPFEAAFGIWFPPAAFLIGPDGRILARDLRGEAIRQAVARALGGVGR